MASAMLNNAAWAAQQFRNEALLRDARYLRREVVSEVLPFALESVGEAQLRDDEANLLQALGKEASRVAIKSLASLAKIGELDHLGGA